MLFPPSLETVFALAFATHLADLVYLEKSSHFILRK